MNPAFRIWAGAIAVCTLAAIAVSFNGSGEIVFMLLLLILMPLASLLSLLGFQCLFESMRYLKLPRAWVWAWALVSIPLIVSFNAFSILLVFAEEFNGPKEMWNIFCEVYPITLIPVTGALAGAVISHKNINAFCTHAPEAYYPDACI